MAARSSSTWTALMTLLPAVSVASVNTCEKVAVTDRAADIVTSHESAVPAQAPLHSLKLAPAPGVAVSVTTSPLVKSAAQVDGQAIPPGELATDPAAEPRPATVSVKVAASIVNVWADEVPPAGVGLNTVTLAVPALAMFAAGTAAVSCVAPPK